MLFLPGTSYAVRLAYGFAEISLLADENQAILSMPFFDEQPWMGEIGRVWVWVVLTSVSTALAILYYLCFTRRRIAKTKPPSTPLGIELDTLDDSEDV